MPVKEVVQQQIALDLYLSNLLKAVPEAKEDEVDSVVLAAPIPLLLNEFKINEERPISLESDRLNKTVEQSPRSPALMPEWSRAEFQVLFFKVEDLILAAPLISLARTIKFDRKPTKIPTQPTWFLGLLEEHDQKMGVLDTGQLIFGKSKGAQRDLKMRPFAHILVSADGKWGLACDEVLSIGKLSPEKVRWRTLRKLRPWLVGTVVDDLTAVIDINQLVPLKK